MLPLEHSAILMTCIKRYLVLKTNCPSFWEWPFLMYSTDFHHLYNHSTHHSLSTHMHSGAVAVPVRSLSGSIIGMIGMISVIPFHSMRAIAELQKKVWTQGVFFSSEWIQQVPILKWTYKYFFSLYTNSLNKPYSQFKIIISRRN